MSTTPPIEIPFGFRVLQVGEILRAGDLYYVGPFAGWEWTQTHHIGQPVMLNVATGLIYIRANT